MINNVVPSLWEYKIIFQALRFQVNMPDSAAYKENPLGLKTSSPRKKWRLQKKCW